MATLSRSPWLEARWSFPSQAPEWAAELPAQWNLSASWATYLGRLGHVEWEKMGNYLHPKLGQLGDPFQIPGMAGAVECITAAIDAQKKIVLYGDYDVDGVTSLTLLQEILQAYGMSASCFLPHRLDEGYGLSPEGVERCLQECAPELLIALDCGTTSIAEVATLRERGVEVLVVDHHEPSSEGIPEAAAVVNPKLGADYHYLCTAGIVFKLGHALLKARPCPNYDLKNALDLVAVGTVADIVPLIGENRLLVRKGLEALARTHRPGLRALCEVSGISPPFEAADIGFRIGPRLNAAGRLDTARDALHLLQCQNMAEARPLATKLDRQNAQRQQLERRILEEARERVLEEGHLEKSSVIAVGARGWHPGVVGIVAARLMRAFHRPAWVVAFDEEGVGKGSGRSIPGFSLVGALEAVRSTVIKAGGHEMAAGLTVSEEQWPEFCVQFARVAGESLDEEMLRPLVEVDAVVQLGEIDLDLVAGQDLLQPFGNANPAPLLAVMGVQVLDAPRVLKEKHLKLRLSQGGAVREAIFFGGAERELPRPPWDIAFHLDRNVYQGRHSAQIRIQTVRASKS